MSSEFLKQLELEKNNEFKEILFNFPTFNRLEIITTYSLKARTINELLYLIFNKFNYLFDFLDYQVMIKEPTSIDKNELEEYFLFIFSTPFL
jgi:hypothetical protein